MRSADATSVLCRPPKLGILSTAERPKGGDKVRSGPTGASQHPVSENIKLVPLNLEEGELNKTNLYHPSDNFS